MINPEFFDKKKTEIEETEQIPIDDVDGSDTSSFASCMEDPNQDEESDRQPVILVQSDDDDQELEDENESEESVDYE